jgi:hypothetical protein
VGFPESPADNESAPRESLVASRFGQGIYTWHGIKRPQGEAVRLERGVSDQEDAEQVLRGMPIGTHGRAGRLPFVALGTHGASRFPNLPGQNRRGDDGSNKLVSGDHRRRLIYGSVDLVVGSLRKVPLGNRGNAGNGSQQKQSERPKYASH